MSYKYRHCCDCCFQSDPKNEVKRLAIVRGVFDNSVWPSQVFNWRKLPFVLLRIVSIELISIKLVSVRQQMNLHSEMKWNWTGTRSNVMSMKLLFLATSCGYWITTLAHCNTQNYREEWFIYWSEICGKINLKICFLFENKIIHRMWT